MTTGILRDFNFTCVLFEIRRHRFVGTGLIKNKGSPYSIAERRVPEPIRVLCSQPASDVSHKPGGRLPLVSARPAVTLATLKMQTGLLPILLLSEQRHNGCEQFA